MRGARQLIGCMLAVMVLALGACGGDEKTPAASGTNTGPTTVTVTLKEWSVAPSQASAPAGTVTFQVTNAGPAHKHELVFARTDLAPQSLPTAADGSVNEEGAGVTALGEIAEFAVGGPQTKEFTMTAGKYVLFCNAVEDPATADMGGIKAHYKLGMFAAFVVT